jgi:hypothetical protein
LDKKDKQHEDNLKFLKTQINQLDESIRDLQGIFYLLGCGEGGLGSVFMHIKLKYQGSFCADFLVQ